MPDIDLDRVVSDLQAEVTAKRRNGDYPEGLEAQLDSSFESFMQAIGRHEVDTVRLHGDVARAADAASQVRAEFGRTSRIPGGSAAHAAIGRVVQRHTRPLADATHTAAIAMVDALRETARLFEANRSADERQFHDVLAAVFDRLAVLDHLVELVHDLEDRVEALETGSTAAR